MSKLKVYGGRYHFRGKSYRGIVAAPNQKEAARIAGQSLHEIRTYWSATGNAEEIAAAVARPGVLLLHRDRDRGPLVAFDDLGATIANRQ